MLDAAFNALLRLHSRPATLKRIGTTTITTSIRITPSNYFRNLAGPSQTIVEGREFVISKASIVRKFDPTLKRGDKIIDEDLGTLTISEINEMHDLGGAIIGWRCRVE